MATNSGTVDPLESALACFDGDRLAGPDSEQDKRRYIKKHLGNDSVLEALDDLYFEAYNERMAEGKSRSEIQNANLWWNRFEVFEDKRDAWKDLIRQVDFDIEDALKQWHALRVAYRRLQNRSDVIVRRGPSEMAQAVYNDMKAQFRRWDGTQTNRGAWWGSGRPGDTAGATNVPGDIISELVDLTVSTSWRVEPSWTGGISFHRERKGTDFIYHMQSPG